MKWTIFVRQGGKFQIISLEEKVEESTPKKQISQNFGELILKIILVVASVTRDVYTVLLPNQRFLQH